MTSDASDVVPSAGVQPPDAIPYADVSVPTARETTLTSGISRGDVAALTVRVFGLYLLMNALTIAGSLMVTAFQMGSAWRTADAAFALYALYLMAFAGVGTWLLLKAPRIAAWLLPPVTGNPNLPTAPGTFQGMQAVAFSIVGLYLALSALPDLAATFARYAHADHDMLPVLIRAGVQVAAGLVLFFKAKRLSAYWQQISTGRRVKADDDSGPL